MVFCRSWNTWLGKTCWGIRSVQVVQLHWELQVELWVAGARGKRPGSGADPLHNKGHGNLWPCQGTRDTAGAEDSAGRPQTMARIRLWGCKSPGDPRGSLLRGTTLGCYCVVAPWKNYLKGPEVWDCCGKPGSSRQGNLVWLCESGECRESNPLWRDFSPSSVALVVGVWLPGWLLGLSDRKVSLANHRCRKISC